MTSSIPIDFLLEESTIDPKSPLPSFLEMKLLETTTESSIKVLKSTIEAIGLHASQYMVHATNNSNGNANTNRLGMGIGMIKKTIAFLISKICNHYPLEIQMLITYIIERNVLMSNSNASISESLFGLKRSIIKTPPTLISSQSLQSSQSQNDHHYVQSMQNSDTIKAALLLALGPYVHERIKLYYERERDRRFQQDRNNDNNNNSNNDNNNNSNNQQRQNNHGILQKLQSLFIYIYPFLHMSNEGIKIAYSFTYMIGKSIYYSPSLHALNQIVRRLTITDINMDVNRDVTSQRSAGIGNKKNSTTKAMAALEYLKGPAAAALVLALSIGWMGQLRQDLRNRRRRLLHNTRQRQRQRQNDLDRNHASVGIRGNATNASNTPITRNALPIPVRNRTIGGNNENNVQGHNSDGNSESDGNSNSSSSSSSMTNIPPPLPPSVNVQSEIILPTNPSLCPLCNQERVNPVASTSGYVFCYRCLALYIRDKGEVCPVTGQRCKESQLTRIYESMDVITNRR